MKEICIYGAGFWGKLLYEYLQSHYADRIKVSFFLETEKKHDEILGVPVRIVHDLLEIRFDVCVIATELYMKDMRDELEHLPLSAVDREKIIDMGTFIRQLSGVEGVMPEMRMVHTHDGLHYLGAATDKVILPSMADTGFGFGELMIDEFFSLTEKYYGVRNTGYFLDIGANIGTTSIYVKKKKESLRIIAFEPEDFIYRMLRCNCVINDTEDIITEQIGLSDTPGDVDLIYTPENPGHSRVYEGDRGKLENLRRVNMDTLDSYLAKKGIPAEEIAYLWIDTEGFETKVLKGGKGLLKRKRIPLLQEFNPDVYMRLNDTDEYVSMMESAYSHFIDLHTGVVGMREEHRIEEIRDFLQQTDDQRDLFFY